MRPWRVAVGVLLNSEASTEAIRSCTPQGEFGARHWPTRSTSARHRIRHGIRHTAARGGGRPRSYVANDPDRVKSRRQECLGSISQRRVTTAFGKMRHGTHIR